MRMGLLRDKEDRIDDKFIASLIHVWEKQGIEMLSLELNESSNSCDLLFVHVDLTVLPPEYVESIARRGLPAINGRAIDIRKTMVSRSRVQRGDEWKGPVIVKTVDNYMGIPEKVWARRANRAKPWQSVRRWFEKSPPFKKYPVFPHQDKVPASWWRREDLLVERFLPERDGDLYVLRKYVFLGSRSFSSMAWGPDPLVSTGSQTGGKVLSEAPPPEVLAVREKLGLDYGKIDYGICDGQCIVYDANKTVGSPEPLGPKVIAYAEELAGGIEDFIRLQ